jgi:hypothetical protein
MVHILIVLILYPKVIWVSKWVNIDNVGMALFQKLQIDNTFEETYTKIQCFTNSIVYIILSTSQDINIIQRFVNIKELSWYIVAIMHNI